jgi:hypothetical protein
MFAALVVSLSLLNPGGASPGLRQELIVPDAPPSPGAWTAVGGVIGAVFGGGLGAVALQLTSPTDGSPAPVVIGAILGGVVGLGYGYLADSGHRGLALGLSLGTIGASCLVLMVIAIEEILVATERAAVVGGLIAGGLRNYPGF